MKGGQPSIAAGIPSPSKTIREGRLAAKNEPKETVASDDPIAQSIGTRVQEGSLTEVVRGAGKEIQTFKLKLKGGQPKIVE